MGPLSKGKSDKHIEHYHTEQEEEYFDAAFDLAFDEAFDQALSAPLPLTPSRCINPGSVFKRKLPGLLSERKECVP